MSSGFGYFRRKQQGDLLAVVGTSKVGQWEEEIHKIVLKGFQLISGNLDEETVFICSKVVTVLL